MGGAREGSEEGEGEYDARTPAVVNVKEENMQTESCTNIISSVDSRSGEQGNICTNIMLVQMTYVSSDVTQLTTSVEAAEPTDESHHYTN